MKSGLSDSRTSTQKSTFKLWKQLCFAEQPICYTNILAASSPPVTQRSPLNSNKKGLHTAPREQKNSRRQYPHVVAFGINQQVLCSMAGILTTLLPLQRIDNTALILSLYHLQVLVKHNRIARDARRD